MSAAGATAWRRVRRTSWHRRAKLLVKRLAGREPWLHTDVRCPLRRHGDWAFVPGRLDSADVVYACGVGSNLGFETELVREYGVELHAFDPGPESRRWVESQRLPAGITFHALGVAESDGWLALRARAPRDDGVPVMYSAVDDSRTGPELTVECLALGSIMRRLRHTRLAMLKLDIEGAEFGALRSMLAQDIHPDQLLVEFHHRFAGVGRARTEAAVRGLRAAGYRLAFISDTGREFTFVRA